MPYAAKSIVQHEFDTDHLNVWIEFRLPMNQLVIPLLNKWILCVDDVTKIVSTSVWQDEYTLLLTVPNIASSPNRVLLSYLGPGPITYLPDDPDRKTLESTWGKQWQPFGPILSTKGTPEPFFVDRGDVTTWDIDYADYTGDGIFHDWNLSSIVPAGVSAVLLSLCINAQDLGAYVILKRKGYTNPINWNVLSPEAAGVYLWTTRTQPIGADRILELLVATMFFPSIQIAVIGWFF